MHHYRPAAARGRADFGWLESRHTFSFGQYHDADHMGFGALRVINEDRVSPGKGFDTHAHKDMEIISYVMEGGLEHKDSIGTGSIIRPGELQRMSAGTGIRHSEFNQSKTDPVHFLQIWVIPEKTGLKPGYEQKAFPAAERQNRLRLIGSRDGREGSLTIHQNVDLYGSLLTAGEALPFTVRENRGVWLQMVRGEATAAGQPMQPGDGLGIVEAGDWRIDASADAEFLLFDLGA